MKNNEPQPYLLAPTDRHYVRIWQALRRWLSDVTKKLKGVAHDLSSSKRGAASALTPLLWLFGTVFTVTPAWIHYAPAYVWIPASMLAVVFPLLVLLYVYSFFWDETKLDSEAHRIATRQLAIEEWQQINFILQDLDKRALEDKNPL